MKLVAALTNPGDKANEDACGYVGTPDCVKAAWVLDGVTGINDRNYLPGASDARWLVDQAQAILADIMESEAALDVLLKQLVQKLIERWRVVSAGLDLPGDYDPPAACLTLAKCYAAGWKVLHLGDAAFLARYGDGRPSLHVVPDKSHDDWLWQEADKLRAVKATAVDELLQIFRQELQQRRNMRNQPCGYSILEANANALTHAEYFDIGWPESLVLCTDGFYRAVDHYQLFTNESLVDTLSSMKGAEHALMKIRSIESSDADCSIYRRFKPKDDATAISLTRLTI